MQWYMHGDFCAFSMSGAVSTTCYHTQHAGKHFWHCHTSCVVNQGKSKYLPLTLNHRHANEDESLHQAAPKHRCKHCPCGSFATCVPQDVMNSFPTQKNTNKITMVQTIVMRSAPGRRLAAVVLQMRGPHQQRSSQQVGTSFLPAGPLPHQNHLATTDLVLTLHMYSTRETPTHQIPTHMSQSRPFLVAGLSLSKCVCVYVYTRNESIHETRFFEVAIICCVTPCHCSEALSGVYSSWLSVLCSDAD